MMQNANTEKENIVDKVIQGTNSPQVNNNIKDLENMVARDDTKTLADDFIDDVAAHPIEDISTVLFDGALPDDFKDAYNSADYETQITMLQTVMESGVPSTPRAARNAKRSTKGLEI